MSRRVPRLVQAVTPSGLVPGGSYGGQPPDSGVRQMNTSPWLVAGVETFKTMERRLLRGIMNPAMVATYLFGVALLLTPGLVEWSRG